MRASAITGDDAWRGRLLASLLPVLIGLGTVSAVSQLLLVPHFLPTFVAVMGAVTVLATAYLINRRGRHAVAAALTCTVPTVTALAAAAANPRDHFAFAFLALAPLLAVVLRSPRTAAALAGTGLLGELAIVLLHPVYPSELVVGAIAFVAVASAVLVIIAIQQQRAQHAQEELLLHADRLAALGTLAAGVAHEANNPLTCASANLQLLGRRLRQGGADGDLVELLDGVRAGTDRVIALMREMGAFARADDSADAPVALDRVIDAVVAMASVEIRQRARLTVERDPVPPTRASARRLEQVFLNLLLNAAQAIPEGKPEENEIRVVLRRGDAGRVEVLVSDTGTGIPPELVERIFEPFFTTKPDGRGTGLGLSIAHGIVSSMGGNISVESQVGQGTTFCVGLPIAA